MAPNDSQIGSWLPVNAVQHVQAPECCAHGTSEIGRSISDAVSKGRDTGSIVLDPTRGVANNYETLHVAYFAEICRQDRSPITRRSRIPALQPSQPVPFDLGL
jgi:hypothetical protein